MGSPGAGTWFERTKCLGAQSRISLAAAKSDYRFPSVSRTVDMRQFFAAVFALIGVGGNRHVYAENNRNSVVGGGRSAQHERYPPGMGHAVASSFRLLEKSRLAWLALATDPRARVVRWLGAGREESRSIGKRDLAEFPCEQHRLVASLHRHR